MTVDFIFLLTGFVYAFTACLVLYQVELRIKLIPRIKCKFGKHQFITTRFKCDICSHTKDRSHLQLIQGGKKELKVISKL